MAERNYLFIHCKSPLKVVNKCAFKKKVESYCWGYVQVMKEKTKPHHFDVEL